MVNAAIQTIVYFFLKRAVPLLGPFQLLLVIFGQKSQITQPQGLGFVRIILIHTEKTLFPLATDDYI